MESEKFYRIKKKSNTHKALERCSLENKKLGKFIEEFMQENGIETRDFYISDRLIIEPTVGDIEKFTSQLKADNKTFKEKSLLNIAYKKGLIEREIDVKAAQGFNLWDYGCRICGGASYKDFFDSGTGHFYLYILLKKEETYNITEDAEEIKGSEFYKALENRNMQVTK